MRHKPPRWLVRTTEQNRSHTPLALVTPWLCSGLWSHQSLQVKMPFWSSFTKWRAYHFLQPRVGGLILHSICCSPTQAGNLRTEAATRALYDRRETYCSMPPRLSSAYCASGRGWVPIQLLLLLLYFSHSCILLTRLPLRVSSTSMTQKEMDIG